MSSKGMQGLNHYLFLRYSSGGERWASKRGFNTLITSQIQTEIRDGNSPAKQQCETENTFSLERILSTIRAACRGAVWCERRPTLRAGCQAPKQQSPSDMAPVAGKDVKLPTELKTYALGFPEWIIYLSLLLWPPVGIALLFTVPTKITISPDGTMRFRAVCRATMSLSLSEDVANLELTEGPSGCSGCVCHKGAIEIYFTDAFLKRRAGSRAEEMKTRPHYVRGQGAQEFASDLCLSGRETA